MRSWDIRSGTERQEEVRFPSRKRMMDGMDRPKWNRTAMKCWVRPNEMDVWLVDGWGTWRWEKSRDERRAIDRLRCKISGCVLSRAQSGCCPKKPDLSR